MQLTHEEARSLIHFASDEGLNIHQKQMLDSHLASCIECRNYANDITRMESILRPLLQRQWTQQPSPLSISMITERGNSKITESMLLAARIAAISVMFMVFVFSTWQITLSKSSANGPALASVPPIPIPATGTQLIGTTTQSQTCGDTTYVVQERDTLDMIASKFPVSKADLLSTNKMKTESITPGTRLIVPLCEPTPTIETLSTTFTPILLPITSTPGG